MSATILYLALTYAQIMLGAALLLTCVRLFRGPRAQDRVLAMDALYMNAMLLILVLGMQNGSVFFFEAAVIIAILGFVTTVALAKFLLRGEVIE